MAEPFQFFITPEGASGPGASSGGDGVGGGGTIQAIGEWGGEVSSYESSLSLRITPTSSSIDPSILTVRWLSYSGEPTVFGEGWVSPRLEPRSADGGWYTGASLDIVPPWGFLPDDPSASCNFQVDLYVNGSFLATLPVSGRATFAHPFTQVAGNELPHYVCPGMSCVVSGYLGLPTQQFVAEPSTWPGSVGITLRIPTGSQNVLSFSPSSSSPDITVSFPPNLPWKRAGERYFRQRAYVLGAVGIPLGAWMSIPLEARGTLPDKPLWGPTDISDTRVVAPEPIVVFNAPDIPTDGTATNWGVKAGREFLGGFADASAAYRIVAPGYRRVGVIATQGTDAAAGLAFCIYNGANDTQNDSNSIPGGGDEQVYRRWKSPADAGSAPVTTVVKPGTYLLLVGTTDTSSSANPGQEFHGTVAVTLSDAPTPVVYNGVSASGTILTGTESTANHPYGQGDMYTWTPGVDVTASLSLAATFRTRLIVTDAVGNILGDAGGDAGGVAQVPGLHFLAGTTYHIEAGRAWDVSSTDLGAGAYTLSSTVL